MFIDIGSRLELFVDDYLIERLHGATQVLHEPAPQGVVMRFTEPWEGNSCGAFTVFQDGDILRMYYRGLNVDWTQKDFKTHPEVVCYAESTDGIHWKKPSLGLCEFEGSTENNIILDGPKTQSFMPFRDDNPDCESDARYKAVAYEKMYEGLYAYKSSDGIHWLLMADEPVITDGAFDSNNLAFWDAVRGEYREYHREFRPGKDSRGNHNGRDIKTSATKDFLKWPTPEWLRYTPGRVSELYTNGVHPYYRAPHIFFGFPTRYVDRGWTESTLALPQLDYRRVRASWGERSGTAVTDGMFMTSRDGTEFHVWPESFIRPGLRLSENWFYGDNYQTWGLVETESHIEGAERELSLYSQEAVEQADNVERLRRFVMRIDGFVSINARLSGGELLTKPLIFQGSELALNFSTGAAGGIRVEVQDPGGAVVPGYAMDDCLEVWGDDLSRIVKWQGGSDLSVLAGQPVRLRMVLADADLYSLQFR
jgi:hypothetical protein